MKKILKIASIAFLLVASVACENDDQSIASAKGGPELLTPVSGSAYVLLLENAANEATTLVWNHADYNLQTEVNYEVQASLPDSEFATVVSGGITTNRFMPLTVGQLNQIALDLGMTPFVAGDIELRIKSSLGSNSELEAFSNSLTISVTPYVAIDPELFLVGASQGYYGLNQWDNTTAMSLRYIGNGTTKIFEGYVKVNSGEGFKLIGEQGTWDNGNFGTIANAQDGNLENSGGSGDIKIAETDGPGLYYLWVDIDNLKYKAVKMNWGIIGSATPAGWDNETPMTFDFANNKFTLSSTLTAGEMKFRAKNASTITGGTDDWKFNVGVSNPTVVYNSGSTNIAVTAGTHNVELHINFDGTATYSGL